MRSSTLTNAAGSQCLRTHDLGIVDPKINRWQRQRRAIILFNVFCDARFVDIVRVEAVLHSNTKAFGDGIDPMFGAVILIVVIRIGVCAVAVRNSITVHFTTSDPASGTAMAN